MHTQSNMGWRFHIPPSSTKLAISERPWQKTSCVFRRRSAIELLRTYASTLPSLIGPKYANCKMQLIGRYGHLAGEALGSDVNEALIEQRRHWLDPFPDAFGLYNA